MNCFAPRVRNHLVALATLMAISPLTHAGESFVCLIQPSKTVEIGTSVYGLIDSLPVERGDFVKKGQVIAVLRNDVERAALGVAKSKAQARAEVQSARANVEFTRQQLKRSIDLEKQEFISPQAVEKSRVDFQMAEQRLTQAQEQVTIWEGEKGLAQSQLAQRTLVSPIAGIVAERYMNAGERVENRAVARIVSISPLYVDVMVPAVKFGKITTGMAASVNPELPDTPAVRATVTLVDKLVDGGSNTFRVRLEVPNIDRTLPAGSRCKVEFDDSLTAAPPAVSLPKAMLVPVRASEAPPSAKAAPLRPASEPDASTPNAAEPESALLPGIDRSARLALENWRKAWERQDLAGYLAAYVADFKGDSPSREAWINQRESRLQKPVGPDISLSDLTVLRETDQQLRLQFRQDYQSQGYRDLTLKSLLMVLDHGRWLIQQEGTQPATPAIKAQVSAQASR